MKYMVNGTHRGQGLVRLTLGCTLVFLALLWATSALLYFQRMGLDPQSVVRYYRGAEAEYAAPRSYGSMLEVAHAHFAMMSMVLLLLTHLAIFLPWPVRTRVVLVLGTFAAALLLEISGWLVRWGSPGFAWLKIASFVALQAGLGILVVGLAWHLGRRPNGAASDQGPEATGAPAGGPPARPPLH